MKTDIIGFQWDEGNWPKCGKHGVGRLEIEHAIVSASSVIDDPSPKEKRFRTVGETVSGRNVFVVFTIRQLEGGHYIRPISARYMHMKEVESYEEGMARAFE